MKHFTFFLFLFLISCNNEKGSANTENARKQFTNECLQALKKTRSEDHYLDSNKKYCDCAADNVLSNLSQNELIQLGLGENTELQKKVELLVQPCLDNNF